MEISCTPFFKFNGSRPDPDLLMQGRRSGRVSEEVVRGDSLNEETLEQMLVRNVNKVHAMLSDEHNVVLALGPAGTSSLTA